MEGFRTIIEPFKIKVVEPISFPKREDRRAVLEKAGFNPFMIPSRDVIIDLLTDSGTAAMSAAQWGGLVQGDEAYAASRSFERFDTVIRKLTGFSEVIPTHQGRAAEALLFSIIGGPGKVIPSNAHFDTTRANVEHSGAEARDVPLEQTLLPDDKHPFKGNADLEKLRAILEETPRDRIPVIMMTVTNNTAGGQPVSMENLRQVRALSDEFGIPMFLDACRFAENAWFIKVREPGYQDRSIPEIVREMFSLSDGCTMSAKKDGLANIGGFLALNDASLAQELRNLELLTEGFPTYGGLAGRDLEAIAQGLDEVLDEDYLGYRIRSIAYLGERLDALGVPFVHPTGGHAVYLDAARLLPHIPPDQFPGQALVGSLYLEGGVRAVEIGSVMFGRICPETGREIPHRSELVRLAFPRRVYTQSHTDFVVEVIERVRDCALQIRGLEFVTRPTVLRHFTARFQEVS